MGNFKHAETFGFVGKGEGFWFANSVGLLELAINRGSAAEKLGLTVGELYRYTNQISAGRTSA